MVVVARLESITALTALVGARIYNQVVPESPRYPLVRVAFIDDDVPYHLRGPVGTKAARVQVDARASDESGADKKQTALNVMAAIEGDGLGRQATGLSGWIGSVGSPPFKVKGVFPQSRRDDYDPEELRVVTVSRDFIVHFRDA